LKENPNPAALQEEIHGSAVSALRRS